jgi:hypothetical protein
MPEGSSKEAISDKLMEITNEDMDKFSTIVSNGMALYAAQNTKDMTIEDVSQWMGKSVADIQSAASGETLGEAAAIYGLYMSYKGEDFDGTAPVMNVMKDAMADNEFKTWIGTEEAVAELDAFKGAMDIISTASGDKDAALGVMTNGFADEELIGIMQGVIGK